MLQFPVPQFIDVEDKIIGPFTIKQFAFVFGGGLLIVALFRILGTGFFFYILALPVAILTLGIAFGKFNGRRIYDTIPVLIKALSEDKKFIFKQNKFTGTIDIKGLKPEEIIKTRNTVMPTAEPIPSRLKQISMLLDQKQQEEIDSLKIGEKK